jgi:predicted TIM-barrel fold metal-dependent hydrolase
MRGIRLNPNYHGYKLDDPVFARLLAMAGERRLIVQLALIMEDSRTLHPLMQVPPVDPAPLAALINTIPNLQVVLLNAFSTVRGQPLLHLAATGKVCFDLGMLEGAGGIKNILQQMPVKHLLFGSHAPFFYIESAVLKTRESPLTEAQSEAILRGNAMRLLGL